MAVYLVTWDLNRTLNYTEARTRFITLLESYAHKKDPGLDSVWFISTDRSADQLNDHLRTGLGENDRLVIVKMDPFDNYSGWLHSSIWEWISSNR